MNNLFQHGKFVLHSGEYSSYKIECDALTISDWFTVARLVRQRVPPFRTVEGVPRGGSPLARALREFRTVNGGLLIVDDVWTTGGSMEAHRAGREACGAVLFARSTPAPWVVPVFLLSPDPHNFTVLS
jgi:orotate phosphoribosyltransferase